MMTTMKKCKAAAVVLAACIMALTLMWTAPAWASDTETVLPLKTSSSNGDSSAPAPARTAKWASGRVVTLSELGDLANNYFSDVYSSNSRVLNVTNDEWGERIIRALHPGLATLYDSDSNTPIFRITVKAAKLKRAGSSTVKIGLFESKKLTCKSNMKNTGITWKSSKPAIATVDENGWVTAVATGKTTITAKSPGSNTVKWTIKVAKVKAAKVKIAKSAAQTFTGKEKKPALTVKYAGETLQLGRDYKVTYQNNTAVGTAKAIVKFRGSFTGTATRTFKINAPKVGKPKITYWFEGDAYSRIEFDGGDNCDGTELWIESRGIDTYDKYIKGDWGYGYCYKAVIGAKAWFYIRSYKKVAGMYFYSPWVKKVL